MEQQAPFAVAVALRGPSRVLLLTAAVAFFWLVLGAVSAQADEQDGRSDGHLLPEVVRETSDRALGDAKALAGKASGGATDVVMDEVEATVGEVETTVDATVRKVAQAAPPVGDVVRKVDEAERAVDHVVGGLADDVVESDAPTTSPAPSETGSLPESSTTQGASRAKASGDRLVRAAPVFADRDRVDAGRSMPGVPPAGTGGAESSLPGAPVDGPGVPPSGLVSAGTSVSGSGGGSAPVMVVLEAAHTPGPDASVLLPRDAVAGAVAGLSRSPGCTPD